jgi:hypothetical protein
MENEIELLKWIEEMKEKIKIQIEFIDMLLDKKE